MYDSTNLGRSHAMSAVSLVRTGLVRVYIPRVGPRQYSITEAGFLALGFDRYGQKLSIPETSHVPSRIIREGKEVTQ